MLVTFIWSQPTYLFPLLRTCPHAPGNVQNGARTSSELLEECKGREAAMTREKLTHKGGKRQKNHKNSPVNGAIFVWFLLRIDQALAEQAVPFCSA